MPKLWSETIESHRRAVHDAILDKTAALVAKGGVTSVTMARIAEESGIGRATLYKYFGDVEAILLAWHERQIASHLARLREVKGATASERLEGVLHTFAELSRHDHATDLSALLHRGDHVAHAHRKLHELVRDVIADGAGTTFRDDVPPAELAKFCLHAVSAAGEMTSRPAVQRLVQVILSALSKAKTK